EVASERETERMRQRLRKLEQLKDEVLSVCAHDLRSPMQVILSHAEFLAGGMAGPIAPAQREHLEAVIWQVNRMSGLIEELLRARRSGIDTLEVNVRPGNLSDTLAECACAISPLMAKRMIRFDVRLDPVPRVAFDESKLRQVVVNLLS